MGCLISTILRIIFPDSPWRRQQIPIAPHRLFPYGHIFSYACHRFSLAEVCRRLYHQTPRTSAVGFYVLKSPALMIRDHRLVRDLRCAEGMPAFHVFAPPIDELLSVSLLSRRIDNRLGFSDYFTNDYLINTVFVIDEIVMRLIREVDGQYTENQTYLTFDIFQHMSLAAHKIMTLIGFGKDLFDDPNNIPFDLAEIFKPHRGSLFKDTLVPTMDKLFRLRVIPESVRIAFQEALRSMRNISEADLTVKNCLMRELLRYDLLNDEEELSKYIFSFFAEVYITVAVVGTWAFYYLASRTATQVGLYNAIKNRWVCMPNQPRSSYQSAVDIDYLDAIIMEAMRLQPVHGVIPLVCDADNYRLTDSQEKSIYLVRGDLVFTSPLGFHLDHHIFDNPRLFVPERFIRLNCNNMMMSCYFPYPGLETSKAANFNRLILKRLLIKFYQCYIMSCRQKEKLPQANPDAIVPLPKNPVRIWLKRTDHQRDGEESESSDDN